MNMRNCEEIHRLNAVNKLRSLSKENGFSDAEVEDLVQKFLATIENNS
jgi:hypothetical protein